VRVVLLLSDGRANVGIIAQEKLSKPALDAFQKGIQTSLFRPRVGNSRRRPDEPGSRRTARGGYYHLRDAEQISPALLTDRQAPQIPHCGRGPRST
jgi:Ca-activated chloride channel family protein